MKKAKRTQFIELMAHPFEKSIIVAIGNGTSMAEIRRMAVRRKCVKWFLAWLDETAAVVDKMIADNNAFCMVHRTRGCAIIRLREFDKSWCFWETLMHELHHFVEDIGFQLNFDDEKEAKAYLQEDLFRRIRRQVK